METEKGDCNSTNTHLPRRSEKERNTNPQVFPKRNRPNRTERMLQPDFSEMYLARRSTEAGAIQDPVSGIAHKIEKEGEDRSVSCVCGKEGRKSEKIKREEEHANYSQMPL